MNQGLVFLQLCQPILGKFRWISISGSECVFLKRGVGWLVADVFGEFAASRSRQRGKHTLHRSGVCRLSSLRQHRWPARFEGGGDRQFNRKHGTGSVGAIGCCDGAPIASIKPRHIASPRPVPARWMTSDKSSAAAGARLHQPPGASCRGGSRRNTPCGLIAAFSSCKSGKSSSTSRLILKSARRPSLRCRAAARNMLRLRHRWLRSSRRAPCLGNACPRVHDLKLHHQRRLQVVRKRGQERAAKPFGLGRHAGVVHFLGDAHPFDRDSGLIHERVEGACARRE